MKLKLFNKESLDTNLLLRQFLDEKHECEASLIAVLKKDGSYDFRCTSMSPMQLSFLVVAAQNALMHVMRGEVDGFDEAMK